MTHFLLKMYQINDMYSNTWLLGHDTAPGSSVVIDATKGPLPLPFVEGEEYFSLTTVLQAAEEATETFNMIEVGAGYMHYLSLAAKAAKSRQLCFKGVAADIDPNATEAARATAAVNELNWAQYSHENASRHIAPATCADVVWFESAVVANASSSKAVWAGYYQPVFGDACLDGVSCSHPVDLFTLVSQFTQPVDLLMVYLIGGAELLVLHHTCMGLLSSLVRRVVIRVTGVSRYGFTSWKGKWPSQVHRRGTVYPLTATGCGDNALYVELYQNHGWKRDYSYCSWRPQTTHVGKLYQRDGIVSFINPRFSKAE